MNLTIATFWVCVSWGQLITTSSWFALGWCPILLAHSFCFAVEAGRYCRRAAL